MDIDQLDIGYTPTLMGASRSNSMKKIQRKDNHSKPNIKTNTKIQSTTPINNKKIQSKYDDYDDLMDELLNDDRKANKNNTKNNKNEPKGMQHSSSIDAFFQQPSSITNKNKSPAKLKIDDDYDSLSFLDPKNKNRTSINVNAPPNASLNLSPSPKQQFGSINNFSSKPQQSKNKLNLYNDDLVDDSNFGLVGAGKSIKIGTAKNHQLGRSRQSLIIEDDAPNLSIGASTRNMKPPLRKRQVSQEKRKQDTNQLAGIGIGNNMSIMSQDRPKTSYPTDKKQDYIGDDDGTFSKTPSRLNMMRKRSSIEQGNSSISKIEHEPLLVLEDSPKNKAPVNAYNNYQNNRLNTNSNMFKNFKNEQKGQSSFGKINVGENNNQNKNLLKPPELSGKQDIKSFDKQFQLIQKTYQKQLSSLKQSLEQQIAINKETRQKILRQTEKSIQEQRDRHQKIHKEQTNRMKEMFQWQKKRMVNNYQQEIESLKNTIEYMKTQNNLNNNNELNTSINNSKIQMQYLEDRLRNQSKNYEDRQKLLSKRQLQLQQRQTQFLKIKRIEEQRLRQEEKRIMNLQAQFKKNTIQWKRNIQNQKQDIAMEMASMEIDLAKRKNKLDQQFQEIDAQRNRLMKQRQQLEASNRKMLIQFKEKAYTLQQEEERLKNMQNDLIRKIRIVQMKMQQAQNSGTEHLNQGNQQKSKYSNLIPKENNWLKGIEGNRGQSRPFSSTKQVDYKKIDETKQRFEKVEKYTKNITLGKTTSNKFQMDQYLMSMAQYTRTREKVY